jgi:hypothetical protein
MSKKIAFGVIGVLGFLKIILLIITGSIFGIVYCSTWLAWFLLIIFAIFIWFFYGFAFKTLYSWKFIIIFLVTITAIICVIGFFTHAIRFGSDTGVPNNLSSSDAKLKKVNSANDVVLVDCTATKDAKIEKVAGWNTYLYPAKKTSPMPDPDKKMDLQESYSLAKLLNKTEEGNVYYKVELINRGYIPRETKKILEICNEDNKTTEYNTTVTTKDGGASENVVASVGSIFSYFVPSKTGKYRIDAWLFANGKWILTDRIEQINIVD